MAMSGAKHQTCDSNWNHEVIWNVSLKRISRPWSCHNLHKHKASKLQAVPSHQKSTIVRAIMHMCQNDGPPSSCPSGMQSSVATRWSLAGSWSSPSPLPSSTAAVSSSNGCHVKLKSGQWSAAWGPPIQWSASLRRPGPCSWPPAHTSRIAVPAGMHTERNSIIQPVCPPRAPS